MAPSPIRVLIVDDHDILRYGLRALLRGNAEVEVIGEAESVSRAVERAAELHPDVILMDEQLPDGSGIDACREILSANPSVRVLFFSAHADERTVMSTLLAGAHGHVAKDLELGALMEALRTVARGGTVFDENLRGRVRTAIENRSRLLASREPRQDGLSRQEERVMALVVEGKTNKEIAAHLKLSEKTVKNYLHNAFQKLGAGRRTEAASLFELSRLDRPDRRTP